MVGGEGIDTVDYSSAPDRIAVYLTQGTAHGGPDAQGDTLSGIENVIGTNSIYTDFLTGNASANTLSGLAGDDELRGLDGNDTLIGGAGADFLDGGAGDDLLIGGIGADTMVGGEGIDTVDYSSAPDRIAVYLTQGTAHGGPDAQGDTLSGIENVIGTNSIYTDFLTGNASANTLSGLAGDDELRGLDGNDTLIGGAGADFLDGGGGTDTAVYSGNRAAYVITVLGGVTTVTGPDGTDTVTNVERLQFADMVTDAAGEPAAQPALAPAGPMVLPAMAADKSGDGPEVLPVATGETAKDGGPRILPAAPGEVDKDAGPEVLPSAPGDMAKNAEPQTLPGETDVFPILGREQLTAGDFAPRDGDIAATLSLFGDIAADDGYLFVAARDPDSPEVLPVMDDDFVLTGKFESPPVMPSLDGDFDGAAFLKDMDFARGLLLSQTGENTNPYVSQDGLTLFDDWSGIASPTRSDVWS